LNTNGSGEKGANVPMVMGCYGIGVTRTMSSIIEQHHDEFGIKWPLNVAPYHVVVVPVKYADEAQKALADKIYEELKKARVEVILDDRNAGFGFKAKDWELIGIPYQIVVGREAANGIVEFKVRETNEKTSISSEEAISNVLEAVSNL
jgi:prolyl-tRNA synthetase